MTIETVHARWLGEELFLLKDHKGFPVVMTQPNGVLGADLLPMSLAGCMAWDIAAILKKQRQKLSAIEVSVSSERENEPPWRFLHMHLVYKISGEEIRLDKLQRAVELAENGYCSTLATLRRAVDIDSEIQLNSV
jgi:putative redox protein